MRKLVITTTCFCLLTLSMLILVSASSPAHAREQLIPYSFADLAEKLSPSVVNISTTQKITMPEDFPEIPQFPEGSPYQDFFQEFLDRRGNGFPAVPATSLGSGFIIDADEGYIITNSHVVKDAEEVRVTLYNDDTIPAEIIGRDEKTDIAVLKIETDTKLTAASFGDSNNMRVGDWIVAIGNPFGLGGTVTAGIISARKRDINSGPYDDYLQTDASINRGNSGGPMFDLQGDVIGINTAIFSPSGGSVGIGFAIPSALAQPVINQIIKYGRTRRGWLGVRIQSVSEEIAETLELPKTEGALVASVTKDGPAEKAGIEAGDIILKINGQDVKEMRLLPRLVAETDIGADAQVTYWRDGKEYTTAVTVGELEKAEEDGLVATGPKSSDDGFEIDSVGLIVKKMSPVLRDEFTIANTIDGIVITEIINLSEAAKKGLSEGDVIVEINQQPVLEPEKLKEIIDKARKNKRRSVLLLINSGGEVRFVALRLDQKKQLIPEFGGE